MPKNPYAFPMPAVSGHSGMTLRDYFAAVALQAHYAKHGEEYLDRGHAMAAYELADAMLEVREAK